MKDNVKQSLSAMLDNESETFEVRRTLDQLDNESLATWSRYQAMSTVLKGEHFHSTDISQQVMSALEDEPALSVKAERTGFLSKPVASVAIAASVTAMVIFGVQNFNAEQAPAVAQAGGQQDIVLPAPQAANSAFIPAQYGSLPSQSSTYQQPDVIRMPEASGQYIQQHQSMNSAQSKLWVASWLPKDYQALSHDVRHDREVLRYTNGNNVITVFVEPDRGQTNGAVQQSGETVALSKRVGSQYVTVVGEMPLMIADRIASAVQPLN